MKNRYLVIGYQRSGTTLIHLLLKGHPNVSALNDELQVSPFFSKGISCFTHGADLPDEKSLGFARMFDTLTTLTADANTVAHGAKCVCNWKTSAQIMLNVVSRYFQDMKIVHVVRNDLVAQYGSMVKSSRSGIMHSWYKGYSNQKTKELRISRMLFTRYVIGCLDTWEVIARLETTNPYYRCNYEEYVSNPDKVKRELFDFIEVPDLKPVWLSSKKVLPSPETYICKYGDHHAHMERIKAQYYNNTLPMRTIFLAKVYAKIYHQLNIVASLAARKRRKEKEQNKLRR